MSSEITIGNRVIGPGHPTYVIAELSGNHSHSIDIAEEIIRGCAEAGVDAVKLQTYTADTMTLDVDRPEYAINSGTWDGRRLYELYQDASTPWEWTSRLMELATSLGLHLFSSPFDHTAVDFLEQFNPPCHKVASFEITDVTLLRAIGATQRPVIMSTGLASREEIERAIAVLRESGAGDIALLKCTSSYPANLADLNLAQISQMKADFDLVIGYSDHSLGVAASSTAVAMGANIIEKHVKSERSDSSPDAVFSSTLEEMSELVVALRQIETMQGKPRYGPTDAEIPMLNFRRSVIVGRDIEIGEIISEGDLVVKRPAIGAEPRYLSDFLGRKAARKLVRGEGIQITDVEN